jgi:integrase
MTAKAARRRSRGDGSVGSYQTNAGQRWYWKATLVQPDGSKRVVWKRGFLVKTTPKSGSPVGALDAMREALVAAKEGTYTEPSKRTVGSWLDEWAGTLRLAPSTVASYRKNIRLHVKPYIGDMPLAALTSSRLTGMYRQLETGGRRDGKGELAGGGLSARTVRYIHTIIGKALSAAVDAEPPLLVRNPAAKASPPTAKQARPPEMHPWTAQQLAAFLAWSAGNSPLHAAWWLLAMTGMRRGELLALRWRDIDLDAATIAVRRSAGVVRNKGEGSVIREAATKTDKSQRVIDIDLQTVQVLQAWRWERELLASALARDSALVFSGLEGAHLHPERFWRTFRNTLARCRAELGEDALPVITIHDLRHTHASLLLSAGEPVKTVSERLGHASATITLQVYAHVLPGDQKRAATRFAALVGEA